MKASRAWGRPGRIVAAIRLEANGPFDHRAALTSLAAHAVEGIEVSLPGEAKHLRLLEAGGEAHPVEAELDREGATLGTRTRDVGVNRELAAKARHWFDLEADLVSIDRGFRADDLLGAQVEARPGVRVTRYVDGFEGAAMTVLGQQVSLAACRLLGARLVAAFGEEDDSGLRRFPAPARVAAEPSEDLRATLRTTGARARTLQAVAALFADGFRLDRESEPPAARERLLGLPGVGRWTVDYLSVRAMSDPDRIPSSDAVVRRALGGVDVAAADALSERWRPFRSYAAMRLWTGQLEAREERI